MTAPAVHRPRIGILRKSTPIGFIFGLGTVMGFIVGVVICYQILYSDVDDHMGEFATLKAMGYQNKYFVALVLQESLWLSLFGFLPGILVAAVLYTSLGRLTGLLLDLTALRRIGSFIDDVNDVHRVRLPGPSSRLPGRSGGVILIP